MTSVNVKIYEFDKGMGNRLKIDLCENIERLVRFTATSLS